MKNENMQFLTKKTYHATHFLEGMDNVDSEAPKANIPNGEIILDLEIGRNNDLVEFLEFFLGKALAIPTGEGR